MNNGWGPKHVHTAKQILSHTHHHKHWGVGFTCCNEVKDLLTEWILEVWVDASHTS